jgi:hypothetical protein
MDFFNGATFHVSGLAALSSLLIIRLEFYHLPGEGLSGELSMKILFLDRTGDRVGDTGVVFVEQ